MEDAAQNPRNGYTLEYYNTANSILVIPGFGKPPVCGASLCLFCLEVV